MTRATTTDTDREERINQILLSYLQAVKAGHKPDRDQVLAANPELCGELEARFADYDEVNRLSTPLREASRLDREGAEALKNSRQTCLPAAAAEFLGASAEATTDIGRLGDFRLLREVGIHANWDALTAFQQKLDLFNLELAMLLVWSPPILEELCLNGDQLEQIADLRQSWLLAWTTASHELQLLDESVRRRRFAEVANPHLRRLTNVLDPQQRMRFGQLGTQLVTEFSFQGPEIARALKFPPEPRTIVGSVEFSGFVDKRDPRQPPEREGSQRELTLEDALVKFLAGAAADWNRQNGGPFAGFLRSPYQEPARDDIR
ncbi:MAG: hypothetical protein ACT4QC_18350 [Planctomycetaceae bacterium]